MASKSAQDVSTPKEIEELLDTVDTTLDRLKTLYEQYFLGIQKQAPAFLHSDVERKLRDLTQINIRNTGLRYRLATLSQKFGSYNSYWRRTLRQIEQGTYVRNLAKIGREAIARGAEIPEEILAAMPKRMREQVVRDRDQAIAIANRRKQAEGGDDEGMLSLEGAAPPELDDVAAMIGEPSQLRRELKTKSGAHVLNEDDGDIDFNAFFSAFDDDAPKAPPPRPVSTVTQAITQPVPRIPEEPPQRDSAATIQPTIAMPKFPMQPGTQPGFAPPTQAVPRVTQGIQRPRPLTGPNTTVRPSGQMPGVPAPPRPQAGPVPAIPAIPSTQAMPRPGVQTPGSGVPRPGVPLPASSPGSGGVPRPAGVPTPGSGIARPGVPMPASSPGSGGVPRPAGVPTPGSGIARPGAPRPQSGPVPTVPSQQATQAIPRPNVPVPKDTVPGVAPVTQAIPRTAPSQASRPNPVEPGAAARTGAVGVESMGPTFPRTQPVARVAPVQRTQPVPKPDAGLKPPPGMTEADVNALHAKYVQAKKLVGEKVDPGSREKLLKTINQTAPKVMEQYKASGVDFSVVVKDNQVVIKAKPKT